MKAVLPLVLMLMSLNLYGQNTKFHLLSGKWIAYGFKSHKDSIVKIIREDCAKEKYDFNKDGNYTQEMFCSKQHGKWAFNDDSTKIGFKLTEFMGQKVEDKLPMKYHHLIIKLTKDTLIIGSEGYYGNERTYGHDDSYFVRKK